MMISELPTEVISDDEQLQYVRVFLLGSSFFSEERDSSRVVAGERMCCLLRPAAAA